jgi:hypothetical protein
VEGHARRADKLLIKPGPAGQAGAGSSRVTSNGRHAGSRPVFSGATSCCRHPPFRISPFRGHLQTHSVFIPGVLDPERGCNNKLVPGNAAVLDGTSDGFFVEVRRRGDDQPVADFEGVRDGPFAFLGVWHLEHAEAEDRHLDAIVVVKGDVMERSSFRTGQDSWTQSCGCRNKCPRANGRPMGAVYPVPVGPAAEAAGAFGVLVLFQLTSPLARVGVPGMRCTACTSQEKRSDSSVET